jgi:hypothetical protein
MRDFDLRTNRLGKTPDAACYHHLPLFNQSIIHSLTHSHFFDATNRQHPFYIYQILWIARIIRHFTNYSVFRCWQRLCLAVYRAQAGY